MNEDKKMIVDADKVGISFIKIFAIQFFAIGVVVALLIYI